MWRDAFDVVRQPHYSPFRIYIEPDRRVAVCLNPKVGSTAFRLVLLMALREEGKMPGRFVPIREIRLHMLASIPHYPRAFGHPGAFRFHCFVRNPYARVVSSWNDKLVRGHRRGYSRSMIGLVPKIRRFAARAGLQGADPNEIVSFGTFLSFVESQREGRRNKHWDTQCSVLLTNAIHYDRIHHFETDFDTGVCEILAGHRVGEDWVRAQLRRPINASGAIPASVLDPSSADRIHRIYRKDFERFGYGRDSWRSLGY